MTYLNDAEKAKIEAFVSDKSMFEAVRKVLLAGIYFNGVLKPGEAHNPANNFALSLPFAVSVEGGQMSAQQLGEHVAAQVAGIRLIETGMKELGKIADEKAGKTGGDSGKGGKNRAL